MIPTYLKAVVLILVPALVITLAGALMAHVTERDVVDARLKASNPAEYGARLYQRWGGYNAEDVGRHWALLDDSALALEARFLELDLLYPFVYGAALVAALLAAVHILGRPFHVGWVVVPVLIAAVADWAENLIQLRELGAFRSGGAPALESAWVQAASVATMVKLPFFVGSSVALLALAIWVGVRGLNGQAT